MTRTIQRTAAGAALGALLLTGCSLVRQKAARYPRPDVGAIYGATCVDVESRPVLLVPGFGGSALSRTSDGARVWGAFLTKGSVRPNTREGLRAFALDIENLPAEADERSMIGVEDDTEAVKFLEDLQANILVTQVDYGLYGPLVGVLEDCGYVAAEEGLRTDGPSGPLYFTFFYDWRRDNVGNAQRLDRFIARAREQVAQWRRRQGLVPRPVKFELIAHSMGGLIARYYLRYGAVDVLEDDALQVTWAGAQSIARVIQISTPNLGSMKALRDLINRQTYPVYTLEPAMIATFASVYQLLPREHHALWVDPDGQPRSFRYADSALWRENRWGPFKKGQDKYLQWLLPSTTSPDERAERMASYMDAGFERARRFAAALDRPPAEAGPTPMVLFTGDSEKTIERAMIGTNKKGLLELKFQDRKKVSLRGPGDGSVTRASALALELRWDGRSSPAPPVTWDRVFLFPDGHTSLLKNPSFHDNLLYLLLEMPARERPAAAAPPAE